MSKRYEPKNFPRLKGLSGISDSLLQDHFKLYEGYVKNVNELGAELEKIAKSGKAKGTNPEFAGPWLEDFKAIAAMRGVGWAIAYQNPETKRISNHWVELHNDGHPPGFRPIVVMDCWEHAFVPDYKATERPKYIEAWFRNVDWRACEARLIK
jgi:Fe-Mn family superoxide dismutase